MCINLQTHLLVCVLFINWSLLVIARSSFPSAQRREGLLLPTVALSWPPDPESWKLTRNPIGIKNLELQLRISNVNLRRDGWQPDVLGAKVYILPAGDSGHAGVANILKLVNYVQSGGLVIFIAPAEEIEAEIQNEVTHELIAQVLNYQGSWQHCHSLDPSMKWNEMNITLSSYASNFLDDAWSGQLIARSRSVQVQTWCKHDDPAAISYPLYTVDGDPMKTVAQAFSRVGSRGAAVWLGYSWRDGLQDGWGALLHHLVASFDAGVHRPPLDASFMDRYPLRLETVLESAAGLAEETAEAVRRLLITANVPVYPGPPNSPANQHLPPSLLTSPPPAQSPPPTSSHTTPPPTYPFQPPEVPRLPTFPSVNEPAPQRPPTTPPRSTPGIPQHPAGANNLTSPSPSPLGSPPTPTQSPTPGAQSPHIEDIPSSKTPRSRPPPRARRSPPPRAPRSPPPKAPRSPPPPKAPRSPPPKVPPSLPPPKAPRSPPPKAPHSPPPKAPHSPPKAPRSPPPPKTPRSPPPRAPRSPPPKAPRSPPPRSRPSPPPRPNRSPPLPLNRLPEKE